MLGFFVGIAGSDVALKGCAPGDVVHLSMLGLFFCGQRSEGLTFGTL